MEQTFLIFAGSLVILLGGSFVKAERVCINYDLREFSDNCTYLRQGQPTAEVLHELCRYGEFCFEVRNLTNFKKNRKNAKLQTADLLPYILNHGIANILYKEKKSRNTTKTFVRAR